MTTFAGARLLDSLKLYKSNYALKEKISDLIEAWKLAFPDINVEKQILAAHAWEMSNPDKRKINKARFLNNWMRIAQSYAESSPVYTEKPKPVQSLPPAPEVSQGDLDEMHRQTIKALGPSMCKEEHCEVCGK